MNATTHPTLAALLAQITLAFETGTGAWDELADDSYHGSLSNRPRREDFELGLAHAARGYSDVTEAEALEDLAEDEDGAAYYLAGYLYGRDELETLAAVRRGEHLAAC